MTEESKPGSKAFDRKLTGRRKARPSSKPGLWAETETPARWKLAEVPSRAERVNGAKLPADTTANIPLLLVRSAAPAIHGELILKENAHKATS